MHSGLITPTNANASVPGDGYTTFAYAPCVETTRLRSCDPGTRRCHEAIWASRRWDSRAKTQHKYNLRMAYDRPDAAARASRTDE